MISLRKNSFLGFYTFMAEPFCVIELEKQIDKKRKNFLNLLQEKRVYWTFGGEYQILLKRHSFMSGILERVWKALKWKFLSEVFLEKNGWKYFLHKRDREKSKIPFFSVENFHLFHFVDKTFPQLKIY